MSGTGEQRDGTQPVGSLADLKDALTETLDRNGTLGSVKARIRAEIFHALEGRGRGSGGEGGGGAAGGEVFGSCPPPLSNENLLLNELIREYLVHNHYHHAASVLLAEAGQPDDMALDRGFLRGELGITEMVGEREPQPLLYGILGMLQEWKEANTTRSSGSGSGAGQQQVPYSLPVSSSGGFAASSEQAAAARTASEAVRGGERGSSGFQSDAQPPPIVLLRTT